MIDFTECAQSNLILVLTYSTLHSILATSCASLATGGGDGSFKLTVCRTRNFLICCRNLPSCNLAISCEYFCSCLLLVSDRSRDSSPAVQEALSAKSVVSRTIWSILSSFNFSHKVPFWREGKRCCIACRGGTYPNRWNSTAFILWNEDKELVILGTIECAEVWPNSVIFRYSRL